MSQGPTEREPISPDLLRLFGDDQDSMERVAARAAQMFPAAVPIVWECNPQNFGFSFVSDSAVALLGYSLDQWLQTGFWAEKIVHDADRDDAVAYCALATAKKCDHMFEYRAIAADGRIVWLRDFVKIVRSPDGKAASLRGVMFDVTPEKAAQPTPAARVPSREELAA